MIKQFSANTALLVIDAQQGVNLLANCCPPGGLHGEFDADTVHRMSVANLHAEFCTALASETLAALLSADAPQCHRVQGNE